MPSILLNELLSFSSIFVKMREVISIHVGQAGTQIGNRDSDYWVCWRFIKVTNAGSFTAVSMESVPMAESTLTQHEDKVTPIPLSTPRLAQDNTFHVLSSWILNHRKSF